MTDRARNEPRDLYDLWRLLDGGHVHLDELQAALAQKLDFRGRTDVGIGAALAEKKTRLSRLWTIRLGTQMAELPEFDDVFRSVQRHLRQAGLGGRQEVDMITPPMRAASRSKEKGEGGCPPRPRPKPRARRS